MTVTTHPATDDLETAARRRWLERWTAGPVELAAYQDAGRVALPYQAYPQPRTERPAEPHSGMLGG